MIARNNMENKESQDQNQTSLDSLFSTAKDYIYDGRISKYDFSSSDAFFRKLESLDKDKQADLVGEIRQENRRWEYERLQSIGPKAIKLFAISVLTGASTFIHTQYNSSDIYKSIVWGTAAFLATNASLIYGAIKYTDHKDAPIKARKDEVLKHLFFKPFVPCDPGNPLNESCKINLS